MRLKLTTAPATEPVSLDEAKKDLRLDGADDNALVTALITAARLAVEQLVHRAFITQTWEMTLDEARAVVEIPRPPLQAVTKIEVVSDAGVKTEVSSAIYDIILSEGSPGAVRLKNGCAWPEHRGYASFIVTFRAGYGDAADSVPRPLREAILKLLVDLYENRGTGISDDAMKALGPLLTPYAVMRF